MIKWLRHILTLLLLAPILAMAAINQHQIHLSFGNAANSLQIAQTRQDTIINKQSKKDADDDDKIKIKEIARAKKQSKPEKVDDNESDANKKRKQRRPEGVERPPEIIRRNGG